MDVIVCIAGVGNVLRTSESDRFGGGSVMVWAGICHDCRTQLKIVQGVLNAVKYRDDILDPIVLLFLQQWNFNHVFQHNNERCHVARVCQDFLGQNHIRVLAWPALSPDLSTIEHVWDELGRRVHHRQNPPETLQELCDALVPKWNNIPEAFIQRLIGSMRRRCKAVVAARGDQTRYWTPQTSILHDNFCLSMICSDNDVEKFCWYCLICCANMNLNYSIFF
jgi:transposase